MSATNLLEEYTNHVFRRVVRIPPSAAFITAASNDEGSSGVNLGAP